MLTKQQALEKVTQKINEPDPYWPDMPEMVVMDEHTIEKEWGWVFFYDSSDHLKSGDFCDQLVGNAPYIINRTTGELVETGTALPTEDYIEQYERKMQDKL